MIDKTILGGVGGVGGSLLSPEQRKELDEWLAKGPPPTPDGPKPKPQMHAGVSVAERGLRQGTEQLRATHLAEMREVSEAQAGGHYGGGVRPVSDQGMEEQKRVRALMAYWREVQQLWKQTKEDRRKNGWRWAKETTEDLRRGLAREVGSSERELEKAWLKFKEHCSTPNPRRTREGASGGGDGP
jgi:hypothetical protein